MKRITKSVAVVALTAIMTAANLFGAALPVTAACDEAIVALSMEEESASAEEASSEDLIKSQGSIQNEESTDIIEVTDSVDDSDELPVDHDADDAASSDDSSSEASDGTSAANTIEVTAGYEATADTDELPVVDETDADLLSTRQVFTVLFEPYSYETKEGDVKTHKFETQKVKAGDYAKEPDLTGVMDLDYMSPVWKYYPTERGGSFFDSKHFNFKTMPITQDITIILGFQRKTMPVTFDPQNGEKPFVEQVTKGDVLGNAYIYEYRHDLFHGVKREGYDLLGWALTKDAKEPLPRDTEFQENMYLYAVWAKSETNWRDIPEYIRKAMNLTEVPKGLWHYDPMGGNYPYTGKVIVPTDIVVFYGNVRLTKDEHYKLTVINNKAVASKDSAKAPTYTISLCGFYNKRAADQVTKFNIVPYDLGKNEADLTFEKDVYLAFNKKVQKYKPQIKANLGGTIITLKVNKDYTLEYADTAADGKTPYRDLGDYKVVVKGKGSFGGEIIINEHITSQGLMSKATVSGVKAAAYTGEPVTQEKMVVKMGSKTLVKDKDYTVKYYENVNAGTARITLTAVAESGYIGTKTVSFAINKRPITGLDTAEKIKPINDYPAGPVTFDFSQLKLPIKVENKSLTLKGCEQGEYLILSADEKRNYDYTYLYSNNNRAGTAKVTFAGVNNFSGKLTATYKILTAALSEDNKDIKLTVSDSYTYTKSFTTPDPEITFKGVRLKKGVDYSVTYKNNTKVNDGKGKNVPTMIIKGKGNYKGTITKTFAITPSDIYNCHFDYEIYIPYKNKKNNYKNKIVVRDTNGYVLKEGVDYKITYTYALDSSHILKDGDKVAEFTSVCAYVTGLGNYQGPIRVACIYQLS
jgi:hypothetical protein